MTVDARGCACPQPVLMAKKAIEKDNEVQVLVDNNTARDNVYRFAAGKGCKVEIKDAEEPGEYVICITK